MVHISVLKMWVEEKQKLYLNKGKKGVNLQFIKLKRNKSCI